MPLVRLVDALPLLTPLVSHLPATLPLIVPLPLVMPLSMTFPLAPLVRLVVALHSLRMGWRNFFFQLCCCVSFLVSGGK